VQAQKEYETLRVQLTRLAATVNAAEDSVFNAFCHKIRVANIREYEESQLKVAQEEAEARLRFDTQIARLTHQFVFFMLSLLSLMVSCLLSHRSEFESEALTKATERLTTLSTIIQKEEFNIIKLEKQKSEVASELEKEEEKMSEMKKVLEVLQETLDGKNAEVEKVKKTGGKAAKALEQGQKEISIRVHLFPRSELL
jgi:structural maintenance of chromosome 1